MIQLPHLETNLTLACQNRCIACNHAVPLFADNFKATMADPEVFERDLYYLGRVARAKVWAAIGGEPLLHPHVVDFLRIAQASNTVGLVEVRTNGQALLEQKEKFWRHTDAIVVTPYKLAPAVRDEIAARCTEWHVRLEWHDPQFVQLLEKATDEAATRAKYATCWFRTFSRVLDRGYFFRCCTTPWIPGQLLGQHWATDGLRVDRDLTEARLAAYLDQAAPANSCRVCCGIATPATRPVPWREIDGGRAAWLEASGHAKSE